MIDIILSIIVYLFQIGCTCAVAAVIFALIIALLSFLKVKLKRRSKLILYIAVLLIICAGIAYISQNPIIICPDEYADVVTEEQIANVKSIAKGTYSPRLPLVSAWVRVENVQWIDSFNEHEVKFSIHYLYFGSITMVAGGDGIAVVKPLGGI